jgi:hypothetical protein
MWPSVAVGAVLFGLVTAWASGAFSVKTKDGVIVIENLPEQANVYVDGGVVTVRPVADSNSGEITVRAGNHRVEVKQGDVTVAGETVSIASGETKAMRIRLEPLPKSNSEPPPPPKVASPETPPPAKVTRDSKTVASPPAATNSAAADRRVVVVQGHWEIRDGELVKSTQGEDAEILFGDPNWTDYDFSVELLREHGNRTFWLLYRSVDPKNQYGFMPVFRNNECTFTVAVNGVQRKVVKGPFHIENRRWYNAVVKVRGNRMEAYVDGKLLCDHVDGRLPKGRVGLGVHTTVCRFRNIKVTAADGTVLWSGLPDLNSSAKTDGPGVSLAESEIKELATAGPAAAAPMTSLAAREFAAAGTQYTEAIKQANDELLSRLNVHVKSLETSQQKSAEQLSLIAAAKQERDAFAARGLFPWSEWMRSPLLTYLDSIHNAERDLERAFEKALDQATTNHDEQGRAELAAQKEALSAPHVIATVDCLGPHARKWGFVLYSNGKLDQPKGPSSWVCSENSLVLTIKKPRKVFVDTCTLAPDGKTYAAVNQAGYRYNARFVDQ